jgi:LCP family protein required for cell wall assembly
VAAIYIKNYSYVEEYNSNWANEFVDNEDISAEFISDIIEKNRINVLVVGLEEVRSDTTFVISYNAKLKNAHIISIPRDTYYFREDFQFSQNNKINSIYQVKGIEGLKDKIEEILKIPINNYIIIDYEAFKVAVDAVEGVEINVPFHMKYDDIKDSPPLRIDIKPGKQTLDGENALKFLRFRKGNPGYESYKHGILLRNY